MDTLLILCGLLVILAGLIWLVMRAFSTGLLWGWLALLPPLTLLYVARHWRRARPALALSLMGVIPLVIGLVLLASHDPQRMDAILSLRWLEPERNPPTELKIELRGELNGQPFAPQHGELIEGVLRLSEGQDFFAHRELMVRLPQSGPGSVRVDVLPTDEGVLPEVELSWLLPEQDLPEARRLSRGYSLHLNLQPQPPNKLVGDFHLVLPPQFKTTLSGRVELFRDGLRYRAGQVDRYVDSRDTLAHVIEDYLQRRFATRRVQLRPLPPVLLPAQSLELDVEALIDGQELRLPIQLNKSESRGWAVRSDRFPALPEATRAAEDRPASAEALAKQAGEPLSRPLDRRRRFSLEALLRSPSRYQDLRMRAVTARGNTAEGRFQGVDQQGRIVLQQRMGGTGQASFRLRPEELVRIELLEP
ncbi:MFS transporter [Pseudomonas benzenivorans]|uniref:MFS transporter n=1 Tax=Pseudomonas benzenivorans TaxID=556533 RepID=A0ABZ0Q0K8_9PSED|nr:MFS transporter [Pseudomonas benzenivorans]WPC07007.1 MFS transporter [Pseudomonas benzenivorans]